MKKQLLALGLVATVGLSGQLQAEDGLKDIHVYKSPTCGCCTDWVDHLKENGFKVEVTETNNLNPIKIDAGLTPSLASCHTAFVGDYVIEGHVPANDIHRLIAEAPKAKGLSVPGMPAGSPGMEVGDRKDRYQVLMFNDSGQTKVFAEHN
ncbi:MULTISPECIES: DUF411 domain-containing protein [Marinobacter]|jgi:hypothetical protein|uniref:DUF411 domain-containing protein n=1 Tax=Marinobacter TaxID=2742 RepID=UPI000FCCBE12|nr:MULTISPECIES: DUF411 domain-containing protein [Marinobacter]MDM8178602.1 DUF411 domain-containing protein [Marinobacter salarius]RUT76249.1 DUF411 domain-containing protein [Marinobacter sp. NP-6]|mmetsp:Transcript_19265/g.25098  ORF Transcript_19265/g.25098 Transcript_19265/m.25098 type:complete len:150 (-) Transcript_19265:43-492(-)|eukprot:CAMPEP_0114365440 /NCGR_PEP_ID=MMETSP0101-20121206/28413_1 /TAXON_ID=38822 ORGANISM="Pteridomonas danica, Strain PT" /NCGR_SAMPLE_ID=MMETSP0101 /ASSEMBLY_ACC=CAM_ASM_000211 /LENGTH=149 /DNA_ID=CAMNT_0001513773 /DNA_START=28 /DNA_END=477 /DNA_ORIENTATION=+